MSIEIISKIPRDDTRQIVSLLLDGEPWSHGSVPISLNDAEVLAWLTEQEDSMREDRDKTLQSQAEV